MPATGPRREEEEDACPALAGDGTPLVGLEREERARWRLECLAAGLDPHAAVDDEHEGVLFDLMLAELLAGIEPDQDGARRFVRVEDDRRPAPARSLDLSQLPGAHGADPIGESARFRRTFVTHACAFRR